MESCVCSASPTLIFACSGGSNVGQLANDACRHLAAEGYGKLYCLAGVGGHVSGIVESSKSAAGVIAVDGCGVKCALKSLEAAGVPTTHHIVLTDLLGIEKNADLFPDAGLIKQTKEKIIDIVK